jgi:HEAT repeat protein
MRHFNVLLVAVACVALALAPRGSKGSTSGAGPSDEVREKQARIESVVAELATRDVAALSPAQREARLQNLARLAEYGKRGVFTVNHESRDRDIPYFIDAAGTRCALAHLIESSGRPDLLAALARDVNEAWISEIDGDEQLAKWLDDNGLAVEEVAYIQAPSILDPTVPPPPPAPEPPPPGDDQLEPGRSLGTTGVRGGVGAPSARGGAATVVRSKKSTSSHASWETWWTLNAEVLANPRAAYHDPSGTTPGSAPGAHVRPERPTAAEIDRDILPVLDRVATGDDLHLAVSGLMSMARASEPTKDGRVVKRILDYMSKPSAPYRNYAVLALGVVPDAAATAPLRAIVLDKPEGRALAHQSPVSEHLRSLAALALGRRGETSAVEDLIGLLAEDSGAGIDLRVACVTALGLISGDLTAQKRVNPFLLAHIEDRAWPAVVAAQVPIALARSQDRGVLPALIAIVDRFKGAREVRQSAAIALGTLGDGLTPDLVVPLMALAQRDPDATSRQFAIMALAELAERDLDPSASGNKAREDLMRKLATFFVDGVGPSPRQSSDRPWYAIAGALFARKFETFKPEVAAALIKLAQDSGARDDRAAAALALGLVRTEAGKEALRKLLTATSDPKVVGFAAESLGMHGDVSVKDQLLELAKSDPDDYVRYRAVLGLARMREKALLPAFVLALRESRSQTVQAALTRAIGAIGDKSAIESLAALASDAEADRASRERALGALGIIGQRADVSWSASMKRGANFTADAPALRTVLTTF